MLAQFYGLMSASVGYVVVAGFVLLAVLLLIQRRRLRAWKRAHRLVTGDYRNLMRNYHDLRDELLRDPALALDHPAEADAPEEEAARAR